MTSISSSVIDIPSLLLATSVVVLYLWSKKKRYSLPLPPGPKGWPLIGNVFDIPMVRGWEVYHKWCKEIGTSVLYLSAPGTNIIVLDTYEDCIALMEKRSAIYSGRMKMPMIQDLMGWDFSFAMADYGNTWYEHGCPDRMPNNKKTRRRSKRIMRNSFNSKSANSFNSLQLKAVRQLLPHLGENTNIMAVLRQYAGGTVLSITYGLDVQLKDDPFIEAAELATEAILKVGYPGAYLVDHFTFLKYVPAWVPGAKFRRDANEWRKLTLDMIDLPFDALKAQMVSGTATPSFAYNLLQSVVENEADYTEKEVRNVSGSMYQAGVDTVQTLLSFCFIALLLYPDELEKIQFELDSFTNGSRLPEFSDEENVPYLKAFIKETLRLWCLLPLSFPHYLSVDDVYKGYLLPANSTIIPNAWAIMHNEKVFVEPYKFNPDRFLTGDNLKEINAHYEVSWGFGRRVCPGRFFAANTLWITLAHILTIYDVKKGTDANGNVIEPDLKLPDFGIITPPKPFPCSFIPCSQETKELIPSSHNDDKIRAIWKWAQ